MSTKKEVKEVKEMVFTINVGKSKTGKQFLYQKDKKTNDFIFVNLVKEGKRYNLATPKNVDSVDITCTSYKYRDKVEDKPRTLTLFNVTDFVFTKGISL